MLGATIGRFRILEELLLEGDHSFQRDGRAASRSEGHTASYSQCQAYRARGSAQDGWVVVKFLPPISPSNVKAPERLRETLRHAANLSHPHIARLIAYGVHQGRPYTVTPHVEAGSLEDRYASGAYAALDAVSVLDAIASALEHAHQGGLVHGVLQPSNVLFDESGQVLVTGFGELGFILAASGGRRLQAEAPYLPPEVRAGDPPTPASDQYSWAVLAAELLTRLPAEAALDLLRSDPRDVLDRPTRPIRRPGDLRPQVASVLARGIADDPMDRFPSMSALNQALRVALGVENPLTARVASPAAEPPVARPTRKLSLVVSSLLALLACGVFSTAGLGYFGLREYIGRVSQQERDPALQPVLPGLEPVVELATPTNDIRMLLPTAFPGSSDVPQATPTISALAEGPASSEETPVEIVLEVPTDVTQVVEQGTTPMAETVWAVTPTSISPPGPLASPTGAATLASSPTLAPTAVSTATPPPSPSATPPPPPSETPQPTIDPDRCRRWPGHPRYCTPTP